MISFGNRKEKKRGKEGKEKEIIRRFSRSFLLFRFFIYHIENKNPRKTTKAKDEAKDEGSLRFVLSEESQISLCLRLDRNDTTKTGSKYFLFLSNSNGKEGEREEERERERERERKEKKEKLR